MAGDVSGMFGTVLGVVLLLAAHVSTFLPLLSLSKCLFSVLNSRSVFNFPSQGRQVPLILQVSLTLIAFEKFFAHVSQIFDYETTNTSSNS